jgi:hypothetical protein
MPIGIQVINKKISECLIFSLRVFFPQPIMLINPVKIIIIPVYLVRHARAAGTDKRIREFISP